METIANRLAHDYPQFIFVAGTHAYWSPRDKHIHYVTTGPHAAASLLHELAHALLGHTTYSTDLELLHKEVAAWRKAVSVADSYGITIDNEHIQDCLDTYRDWLHKRSTCPQCHANGLQTSAQQYRCLNCSQQWQVSTSRFCRPYRRTGNTKKSQDNVPALSRFV